MLVSMLFVFISIQDSTCTKLREAALVAVLSYIYGCTPGMHNVSLIASIKNRYYSATIIRTTHLRRLCVVHFSFEDFPFGDWRIRKADSSFA